MKIVNTIKIEKLVIQSYIRSTFSSMRLKLITYHDLSVMSVNSIYHHKGNLNMPFKIDNVSKLLYCDLLDFLTYSMFNSTPITSKCIYFKYHTIIKFLQCRGGYAAFNNLNMSVVIDVKVDDELTSICSSRHNNTLECNSAYLLDLLVTIIQREGCNDFN